MVTIRHLGHELPKKPLIAINLDLSNEPFRRSQIRPAYIEAIERAGGVPLLIPHVASRASLHQILQLADAVLLIGGDDIDPKRYGGTPVPSTRRMESEREELDFAIMDFVEQLRLPVLGICCGLQLINVHRGGRLIEDVPHHRASYNEETSHAIQVSPGSALARIIGVSKTRVNSIHHQAISVLGSDLVTTAIASDGTIEAIEGTDPAHFVLGVQWHPERMIEDRAQRSIFDALVSAADARRSRVPLRRARSSVA